jgi:polyisoprenoid-binding protein YceI
MNTSPSTRPLLRTGVLALAGVVTLGATAEASPEAIWNVDESHTEVNFEVRHFFTPVNGSFRDFDITLDYDPENPESSQVDATIQVASVDTGNDDRDQHLRTADWFNAEEWPAITFESRSVRSEGPNQLVAVGDLTIKDVTREVEMPIEVLGIQEIPPEMQEMIGAEQVASFRANLEIDRRDYDVGTGRWAETAVVGAPVNIEIVLEAGR